MSSGTGSGTGTGTGMGEDEDEGLVRPFLLTGGRTRPAVEGLRLETLVRSLPEPSGTALRFEAQRIVEACRHATSVAELSGALHLPVGVVRILVADLVAQGAVETVAHEELSIPLIERIRDRVRAL